jgi:hypothetical protein
LTVFGATLSKFGVRVEADTASYPEQLEEAYRILQNTPTVPAASTAHLHNDDLLTHVAARARVQIEYPSISHVLDNPELRAQFQPVDNIANSEKRRSQGAGILAVGLSIISLATTTAEPAWHGWPSPWPTLLVLLSAIVGLSAIGIATFGILYGKRKQAWLYNRLFTERLRQLHFQSFIWRLPEIAASMTSPKAVQEFQARRTTWLTSRAENLRGNLDGTLASILNPARRSRPFLFDQSHLPTIPLGFDPTSLFEAYNVLRIDAQIAFADHKLGQSTWSLDPRKMSIRLQERQFGFLWGSALALLVLLHLSVIVGTLGAEQAIESAWLHVAITWLAILALAVKTLQDGLGLRAEIARYEEYRAEVSDIRTRFEHTLDPERKLALMVEMEEASYNEMRDFLRIHHEATFVL